MKRNPDFPADLAGICNGGLMDPSVVKKIDLSQHGGFPDAGVDSHTGEHFRFYEDRIKDKVFLVNFMTIRNEEVYPVTANLAKIADRLGDKLGREVFINSITMDPEHDTLLKLQEFAAKHHAGDGWCFLRARKQEDAGAIMQRMYHFNRGGVASGLVFYGNGNGNLRAWGSFPGLTKPEHALERVSWVFNGKPTDGTRRMAGPRRPGDRPDLAHNRQA